MGADPTHAKKRRRGTEKSKTGCLTCRIRRIKCDEAQPYCRKCTITGRKCEGPVVQEYLFIQDQPGHDSNSLTAPPSCTIIIEAREKRAFEFFFHRAAPVLSGPFDAPFWRELIPRLSQSEPIIRDAMLAISCFYEHPPAPTGHGSPPAPTTAQYQALKWYNRAISRLKARMQLQQLDYDSSDSSSSDIALLSCLLFTCIESQRDSIANVVALLGNGFRLLSAARNGEPSTVYKAVAPFFARHAAWEGARGYSRINPAGVKGSDNDDFSNLHDARTAIFSFMEEAHGFIKLVNNTPDDARQDLAPQQQYLLSKLGKWYSTFLKLDNSKLSGESCVVASSMLLMMYHLGFIWLRAKLSPSETAYDAYNPHFEQVIHHARVVVDSQPSPAPCFTFEIGVMIPLFFVVAKCRHPIIRRQALALIKKAPAKESLWSVGSTARTLERLIQLEEEENVRFVDFPQIRESLWCVGSTAKTMERIIQLQEEENVRMVEFLPTRDELPYLKEESQRMRHLEVVEIQPDS